jgi:hypothetical protein
MEQENMRKTPDILKSSLKQSSITGVPLESIQDNISMTESRTGSKIERISSKVISFLNQQHHGRYIPRSIIAEPKPVVIEAEPVDEKRVVVSLDLKYSGNLKAN